MTAQLAGSSYTGIEGHATEAQDWGTARLGPVGALGGISESARQFGFEASDEGMTGGWIETAEHQPIDGDVDFAHVHPRISFSESGRSVLIAS
jgi:hypothetical protein